MLIQPQAIRRRQAGYYPNSDARRERLLQLIGAQTMRMHLDPCNIRLSRALRRR